MIKVYHGTENTPYYQAYCQGPSANGLYNEVRLYTYTNYSLVCTNPKSVTETLQKKLVSTIDEQSAIMFEPGCKYPRFKLKTSQFVTVHSLEDADCLVVRRGDFVRYAPTLMVVETDLGVITIDQYSMSRFGMTGTSPARLEVFKKLKFFINDEPAAPTTFKWVYSGPVATLSYSNAEAIRLIMSDNCPSIIYDDNLDKIVTNTKELPEYTTVKTIVSYLQSPDSAIAEAGWKMLANLNYTSIPYTTSLLICTFANELYNPALSGAACKAMLSTMGYNKGRSYMSRMYKNFDAVLSECKGLVDSTNSLDMTLSAVIIDYLLNLKLTSLREWAESLVPQSININMSVYTAGIRPLQKAK